MSEPSVWRAAKPTTMPRKPAPTREAADVDFPHRQDSRAQGDEYRHLADAEEDFFLVFGHTVDAPVDLRDEPLEPVRGDEGDGDDQDRLDRVVQVGTDSSPEIVGCRRGSTSPQTTRNDVTTATSTVSWAVRRSSPAKLVGTYWVARSTPRATRSVCPVAARMTRTRPATTGRTEKMPMTSAPRARGWRRGGPRTRRVPPGTAGIPWRPRRARPRRGPTGRLVLRRRRLHAPHSRLGELGRYFRVRSPPSVDLRRLLTAHLYVNRAAINGRP